MCPQTQEEAIAAAKQNVQEEHAARAIAAAERCKDCEGVLRKRGPAWRNGVSLQCYQTLLKQTWETYDPNLHECTDFSARTLFIGNLPYTTTDEEVKAWVRELMLDTRGTEERPDNFTVRCRRGGHQGEHGFYRKMFKIFAFVQFELVRDACTLLEKCSNKQFKESGRIVVPLPSVVKGSCIWRLERRGWQIVPRTSP